MKKTYTILILTLALAVSSGCSERVAISESSQTSESVSEITQNELSTLPNDTELNKTGSRISETSSSKADKVDKADKKADKNETSSNSSTPDKPKNSNSIKEDTPAQSDDWKLLLVNHDNAIDGNFAPELANVQNEYKMDARVAPAMIKMISDAKSQGVSLLVCSAYRPYSSQERNFNAKMNEYMSYGYSKEKARTATLSIIAAPGKSEHQTGLAADIVTPAYQGLDNGYANTAAAKWLLKNAADYGFILRYPSDKTDITQINFEPWHYRYVGVEAAKEIMGQKLCLEEYLA